MVVSTPALACGASVHPAKSTRGYSTTRRNQVLACNAFELHDEVRAICQRWSLETGFVIIVQNAFHDLDGGQGGDAIAFGTSQFGADDLVAVSHLSDQEVESVSIFLG